MCFSGGIYKKYIWIELVKPYCSKCNKNGDSFDPLAEQVVGYCLKYERKPIHEDRKEEYYHGTIKE